MESPQLYIVNVNNICRTCLAEHNEMVDLFELNDMEDGIIKIFSIFTGYEVEKENGSCNMCNVCINKLRESFIFYQQCQKSGELYMKVLQSKSAQDDDEFLSYVDVEEKCTNEDNKIVPTTFSEEIESKDFFQNDNKSNDFIENSANFHFDEENDVDDPPLCNFQSNGDGDKKFKLQINPNKKQLIRLKQYSVQEVEQAILNLNKLSCENTICIKCDFNASNTRTLSTHMHHVHKELKDRWCATCNQMYDDFETHTHKVIFTCVFCKKEFASKGHLTEHLHGHSGLRPYKCEECNKTFIAKRHLRTHLKSHFKKRAFICKLCSESFQDFNVFKQHLTKHEGDIICPKCNGRFESKEQESEHKCVRREITNNSNNAATIEDIAIKEDLGKPQNFCEECNRKVRSLGEHYKTVHGKILGSDYSGELCTVCGKQYRTKSKLTVHMRTHTGEAPYKCSYCNKAMRTRTQLNMHERVHTGERPYSCNICGKTFTQSSIRNTHMRLHTGRTDVCKICGQKFCRPGFLRLHMRKHTGEKPYMCNECGQTFVQHSHLTGHLKTHTDERPFKCTHCDKSFKHKSTLNKHVDIHLGFKPFKCSQCPYSCRKNYRLALHMRQNHNDQGSGWDKPYICQICNERFNTHALLLSHSEGIHKKALEINNQLKYSADPMPKYDEHDIKFGDGVNIELAQ